MAEVHSTVKAVCSELGYPSLKEKQLLVITEFLSGRDVFAALPTGYGKSLCYSCLPPVFDKLRQSQGSIAIVVSPLLALMKDQVESLRRRGVSAAYVASGGDAACEEMKAGVVKGKYQLVFISPEQLIENKRFRCMCQEECYQNRLIALVIDEAHCVKKW